jgi:predicted RNA binding protein YcfA (HicA-like mRNA interferase family)
MKYSEMHRIIRRCGWIEVRQSGSHVIYEKDEDRYPVPNHGAKEVPEGLRKKIFKDMGLE